MRPVTSTSGLEAFSLALLLETSCGSRPGPSGRQSLSKERWLRGGASKCLGKQLPEQCACLHWMHVLCIRGEKLLPESDAETAVQGA